MLAQVLSSAVLGVDAYIVDVEVDIALGLPTFNTVGNPSALSTMIPGNETTSVTSTVRGAPSTPGAATVIAAAYVPAARLALLYIT